LNASAGVIEKGQESVIALAFEFYAIRLCENRSDLVLVQVRGFHCDGLFGRDTQYGSTLRSR
jgi:hypothetical protein